MDYPALWFVLLGVLLAGYAILDGFDLGVGILHLAVRDDHERRILLNSIGPIWDGNEVWLVTFGGALFAAFPGVYATAFSGLYTAFMLLLFALIFRAVSIEFRSKHEARWWRRFWDVGFFLGSLLATVLFGVCVGNAMKGMAIAPLPAPDGQTGSFEHLGGFFDLLGFYPVLVALFAVSLMTMHGAIYLYLKTEGPLQARIHGWIWRAFGFFLILYVFTTAYTLVNIPNATQRFSHGAVWPWFVVLLNILAIANIPRAIYQNRPAYAFISSCCTIAAFIFLFGVALFPNMMVSSIDPNYNLTIYNSCSSPLTLKIMTLIAAIGMPFVLAYTAVVYWTFRGRVTIGKLSY